MSKDKKDIKKEDQPKNGEAGKKDKKKNYEELDHKYKLALADYQNLLKQTAKEKQEFAKYANEQLIQEMLPVYDNLKISLDHAGEEITGNGWAEGIKHVIRQFAQVLENMGVKEIKTVGEKLDHNTMEAIEKEVTDDKKKDDIVVREVMAGYKLQGKTMRAARVVVYEYKK